MKTETTPKSRASRSKKPYSKGPYTSKAKQVQIEAFALSGMSKSQIAKATHADRVTVARILSRSEVEIQRALGRSVILSSVQKLSRRLVRIAEKDDLEAILACLRGVGVLTNKLEIEETDTSENRTYAFPRMAFFFKYKRWPTIQEAMLFDKTIEVEPLVKESAAPDEE